MNARQLLGYSWCTLLAAGGMVLAQSSDLPVNWRKLPEPFHSKSSSNRPQVVPRPEGADLKLPGGFHAEVIADGFEKPRFMLLGPTGEVLITDSGKRNEPTGSVVRLMHGKKTVLLEGLDRPYGLARHQGFLYVAEPTSVKRYPYRNLWITGEGEEVLSLEGFGKGHWTRTLLFDRQREKLYVTVGSSSNIGKGDPPIRAAVSRINPDGSGHEIFATGLRNTVGLRWRPGTDELWGSVQERDGLGDDLPDDYLVRIRQGGFYGFPDAYSGPHKEPRHKETDQEKVDSSLYPDVLLGAHVSVLDILFYSGSQFPEKYHGGLFLAFRGSSNRSVRVGYSIAFIPFLKGRPTSGPTDFLTGWMLGPDRPEVWGRPVGLLQTVDGSLLISDDGAGKIWRVSYEPKS